MRREAVERGRARRLAVLGTRFSEGVPMPTTLLMGKWKSRYRTYFERWPVATAALEARAPHPLLGAALVS